MNALKLVFDNIRRNPLRTILMSLGTMVLVVVVTLVFTILDSLDRATAEKSKNLKALVTERWQLPSQMPYTYATNLSKGAASESRDVVPDDCMTWGFYAGTTSNTKKLTFDSLVFAFVTEPRKLRTMMDDLDSLSDAEAQPLMEAIERMEATRSGMIVGADRLKKLNKKVGDRIKLFGRNFKDIDLELEIVGVFPRGRYDSSAAIRRDYFNAEIEKYALTHKGQAHPLAAKTLNLVWLRVPDKEAFNKVSQQISESPFFTAPAVKVETSSSGIASFLDAFKDIIWGVRWLLAPACVVTLALVIANAISISVRERRMEFAILKVLGYRPSQILMMVIAEALVVGTVSGLFSAVATYSLVNYYFEGIPFRIAFFPSFLVPLSALWWGVAMGAGTAFLGSIIPALSAQAVKVSDVFARVA
jgi:putative ABC transport system permease protein